jgi:hypothetical protein
MKITKRLLQSKGACEEETEKFALLFPKGVELTGALCLKHAADFNFDWAAEHLLSPEQLKEYRRIKGPAWSEYRRIKGPARSEYLRIKGPAWSEYERSIAVAFFKATQVKAKKTEVL